MKLSKLRIKNFRSFKDETINLDSYNCFVGPNGAGKSTVLTALNILFRNEEGPGRTTVLSEEDFHKRDTSDPIEITATFGVLSNDAKEDLSAYVRQDQLVIMAKAIWDGASQSAEVTQHGMRMVMKDFTPYFKADDDGAKASDLKDIYREIRNTYPNLPDVYVKAEMRGALRDYEEAHPEECELEASSDQFYGFTRGKNRLDKYIQWVYIPAVKDATDEQEEGRNTALGELLGRTIRQKVDFGDALTALQEEFGNKYKKLISAENQALESVGVSLQRRLREWAHPGVAVSLVWSYDSEKSVSVRDPNAVVQVGERDFLGELHRMGHGLQRSFLVALLSELAVGEADDERSPTLLLGIEEPELYQHPPQARHLADVLQSLADSNSQVLITTHSPYFVVAEGVPNVRMTRYSKEGTSVTSATFSDIADKLGDALNEDPIRPSALMSKIHQIMKPSRRELYFSRVPVLVEGPEDIAFISTHLHLTGQWDEFRRLGCHFIDCGGKNKMSRPLAISLTLGIPAFVIFDGDCDNDDERTSHERDNGCLMKLCGMTQDPWFEATIWSPPVIAWRTKIGKEIRHEIGSDDWRAAVSAARRANGMEEGVREKEAHLVAATLEELWKDDVHSEYLSRASELILEHATEVERQLSDSS